MGSDLSIPGASYGQHPVGIGLRKELADALLRRPDGPHSGIAGDADGGTGYRTTVLRPDFVEVSTENWAG